MPPTFFFYLKNIMVVKSFAIFPLDAGLNLGCASRVQELFHASKVYILHTSIMLSLLHFFCGSRMILTQFVNLLLLYCPHCFILQNYHTAQQPPPDFVQSVV